MPRLLCLVSFSLVYPPPLGFPSKELVVVVSADARGLKGLGLHALDGAILQPQWSGLGRGVGELGRGAASLKPEAVFAASGSASGIHLSTDKQTNHAQHQLKESSEPSARSCPEKQGNRQRFWLLTRQE